jgi:hypothetical protein
MFTSISQMNKRMAVNAGQRMLDTAVSPAQITISRYAPISLSEMAGVALLNRTDTKFVMTTSTLLAALQHLHNDYRVLEVEGVRLHHYRTLYFDTADFAHYYRHHVGASDRYKVRSRAYLESNLSFFEVKHKTNKKRTIKDRLQTEHLQTNVDLETAAFLADHYPYEPAELLPALWNSFIRITLVSNHRPERLTLDFDLSFEREEERMTMDGVAIAEVKREGFSAYSDFIQQMRVTGVRRTSFSKYCLGLSYLYPQLKHNNFKPKHMLVQKLMQGESHVYYH